MCTRRDAYSARLAQRVKVEERALCGLPALKHHHRHEGDHHGGIERDVVLTNLAARGGWQGITMQE